jgi:hypothetical protein
LRENIVKTLAVENDCVKSLSTAFQVENVENSVEKVEKWHIAV